MCWLGRAFLNETEGLATGKLRRTLSKDAPLYLPRDFFTKKYKKMLAKGGLRQPQVPP
jgi:hypothetical protein